MANESVLPFDAPAIAFVISRSGTTTEAILACEFLNEKCKNVVTVGLTCHGDSLLTSVATESIALNHAQEKSVVMTQSFSNMLMAIQIFAAKLSEQSDASEELSQVPALIEANME